MPNILFAGLQVLRYEGPETDNPFAYRWCDPAKVVLDKPLGEQLRLAIAY